MSSNAVNHDKKHTSKTLHLGTLEIVWHLSDHCISHHYKDTEYVDFFKPLPLHNVYKQFLPSTDKTLCLIGIIQLSSTLEIVIYNLTLHDYFCISNGNKISRWAMYMRPYGYIFLTQFVPSISKTIG